MGRRLLFGRNEDSLHRTQQRRIGSHRRKMREVLRKGLEEAYEAAARSVENDGDAGAAGRRAVEVLEREARDPVLAEYESTIREASDRLAKAARRRRQGKSYRGWGRHTKDEASAVERAIDTWLATHAAERITNIEDTTREQVRRIVSRARRDGQGMQDIARRVRDVGPQFSRYRSQMIARTETLAGWMGGETATAKRMVPDMGKEWINGGDDRVRGDPGGRWADADYSHYHIHGQVVGMDERFDVDGELLDHPGDPGGSAANVINCRCVLGYVED